MTKTLKITLILTFVFLINELNAQEQKVGIIEKQAIIAQLIQKENPQSKAKYLREQWLAQRKKENEQLQSDSNIKAKRSNSSIMPNFYGDLMVALENRVDNAISSVVKDKKIKHLLYQYSKDGQSVILYADSKTYEELNISKDVYNKLTSQK